MRCRRRSARAPGTWSVGLSLHGSSGRSRGSWAGPTRHAAIRVWSTKAPRSVCGSSRHGSSSCARCPMARRRLVQLVVAPPARRFRKAFGDGLSLTEMPHDGMGALFQDCWDCAVGRLIADHGGSGLEPAGLRRSGRCRASGSSPGHGRHGRGAGSGLRRSWPGPTGVGRTDRTGTGGDCDRRGCTARSARVPRIRDGDRIRPPGRPASLPGCDGDAARARQGGRRSGSAPARIGHGTRG